MPEQKYIMRHIALAIATLALPGCAPVAPAEVPAISATQRQAVVLDIDGTLTPRDLDVFEPRQNAADAVNAYMKKGYKVVYVTTRVPVLQATLPDWLRQNGFPAGTLHVAQTAEERASPADFKARVLGQYVQVGWRLEYAYGDSTTDFDAYARAGIPRDHVFALKRRNASQCQEGVYELCLDGWTQHLPFIERQVPSAQ